MRIIVQRVKKAEVAIGGKVHAEIGCGLMILVGVEEGDTRQDAEWLAGKTARLRIFNDAEGVMNLSVEDIGGEVLAVSQFTLTASTRKGNRPSYIRAARPETAAGMYEDYCSLLESLLGREVKRGEFGADMQVSLTNDGPVTIMIDSLLRE